MSTKKSIYNVSLNSQGFILSGTPERPAWRMSEAAKLGEIPRVVDLDYSGASPLWLPWAQTDWSGGFQAKKWSDDAKYRTGSNIDPLSTFGEVTLVKDVASVKADFADGHTFGAGKQFNDRLYVGTKHASTAQLWNFQSDDTATQVTTSWTDIINVNDFDVSENKLYMALQRDAGSEATIETWNGSSLADVRTTSDAVRMVKVIGDRVYAGELNSTANGDRLIYSDDQGTTWIEIISKTGQNRQIIQGVVIYGVLYFLIQDGTQVELWQAIDTTATKIWTFDYLSSPKLGKYKTNAYISGKDENGDVIIFEWNGVALSYSFVQTITNSNLGTGDFTEFENNLHVQGLTFDGLFWFSGHEHAITSGSQLTPFASFGSSTDGRMYFYGTDSGSDLEIYKLSTTYVSSGTFTVGNFFANKPSIKKLYVDIDANFEALEAGEKIKFEYSTDDGSTYTSIEEVDFATYGAVDNWTFTFPANVSTKKIILRCTLTAGTSQATTPTLLDFVARYRPVAEDKYTWQLSFNCSDKIQLMDRRTFEPKKGVELRNLLRVAEWNNQLVDFEDIDFVENTLNGSLSKGATSMTVDSTSGFPEQGRVKVENEEITYTGKTATTLTGLIRGVRGTQDKSHSDNTAVNTIYKVFITNYEERLPVANESQTDEFQVIVTLVEK